jgi:hypothetical protein
MRWFHSRRIKLGILGKNLYSLIERGSFPFTLHQLFLLHSRPTLDLNFP